MALASIALAPPSSVASGERARRQARAAPRLQRCSTRHTGTASREPGAPRRRPAGVHPASGLQRQGRPQHTLPARRQARDAAPRTRSTPRSTPPGPPDGTRSEDSPTTTQLSLHLLPRDRRRRVHTMRSEPSAELRLHLVGDGHALGLLRDPIPKALDVENALGRGHLIEGGFHRVIVVAADHVRQIRRAQARNDELLSQLAHLSRLLRHLLSSVVAEKTRSRRLGVSPMS